MPEMECHQKIEVFEGVGPKMNQERPATFDHSNEM
jgi:hypothetical protein